MKKPLEGIKMLDLTHMLSGPYGAMIIADLGADTVKVEPPNTGEGHVVSSKKTQIIQLMAWEHIFLH